MRPPASPAPGATPAQGSPPRTSCRILTDLISGAVTPLTQLPTVNHRSPRWEPEPLRWLGIRYAQEGFARLDRDAERTGKARPDARWWSGLAATELGEESAL